MSYKDTMPPFFKSIIHQPDSTTSAFDDDSDSEVLPVIQPQTQPLSTPTNRPVVQENVFPEKSPRFVHPHARFATHQLAAVQRVSVGLQKVMLSAKEPIQHKRKSCMFGALLEPLSLQLPPANVDVFGDATLRPAKRMRDKLHETTDVDEESPASKQFKGEACAISGCPKDGGITAKDFERGK